MSASTRTIQQPMANGSMFGTVAVAAVVLVAALSIAWGATNLAGTKSVATPVQAPALLDKGGRGDLVGPAAGTAPTSILDRGGRTDLRGSTFAPNGERLKDDTVLGASSTGAASTGASSVGASSAAHATRTPIKPAGHPTRHAWFRAQ